MNDSNPFRSYEQERVFYSDRPQRPFSFPSAPHVVAIEHAVADYARAFAEELREVATLIETGASPSDLGPRVARLGRMLGHQS